MAKFNLKSLSKTELEKLKADVHKALSEMDKRLRADAKKAAETAARKYGYSLGDLVGAQKARKSPSVPKYRNPADPKKTWTGKGRQPGWIKEGLAKGKKLSDFAI